MGRIYEDQLLSTASKYQFVLDSSEYGKTSVSRVQ